MPATTFVNLRTVVHKGSGDTSFAFPDVCNTPPLPVPVPYPNVAKSSDAARTAASVLSDGNPIMVKDSHYALSTGDEAGNAPGNLVTGVIKGKAYFTMYSFDVMAEGKNVCRFLDPMTHNHSSSPPPGTPPGPDVGGTMTAPTQVNLELDLVAGIVKKVTCQSGIPMESRGFHGPAIPNPYPRGELPPAKVNWQRQADGSPPPKEKSYPAVYTIQGGGCEKNLEVDIEITELEGKYVGKNAELFGDYLGLPIKAKAAVSLKKGPITGVACSFVALPTKLTYVPSAGITWFLKIDGLKNPVCIGETKIELFFIYAKPKKPWAGKKVWYEAVRYAFTNLDIGNRARPLQIMKRVTIGLHYSGVRYDTVNGANRYHWHPLSPGPLEFSQFIEDVCNDLWAIPFNFRPIVNCNDTAGLFVLFGTLLGVPRVSSIFLGTPGGGPVDFGYIKTTFLVGITTLCNNPFYSGGWNPNPNVGEDDKLRSSFGNHVFGVCSEAIFDPCAGPYKGDGMVGKYVQDAIDARRSEKSIRGWSFPALLQNMFLRYDVNAFC